MHHAHCKRFLVTLTMFWSPQLYSFSVCVCVCDTPIKLKECLEFEQSIVVISISFQKAYKSTFLVRFVVALILHICHGEFLGCMLVVEMPGM